MPLKFRPDVLGTHGLCVAEVQDRSPNQGLQMNLASIDEHQDRLCEPTALGVFKISVAQFLAGKLEGVTEGDQFMRLKATSARHEYALTPSHERPVE